MPGTRHRSAKRVFAGIGVLLALALAGLLVVPRFLNWSAYRPLIEDRVRAATGFELRIDGDIGLTLLPAPAVSASGLRLSNPSQGAADIGRARSLRVQLRWPALLAGRIEIGSARLVEPEVEFETGAERDGGGGGGGPQFPSLAEGLPVHIARLDVENGRIVFRDAKTGRVELIERLNARLGAETSRGPFRASGDAVARGVPVIFDAAIAPGGEGREARVGLSLDLRPLKAKASFDGGMARGERGIALDGRLRAEGASLAALVEALVPSASTPAAFRDSFGVEAALGISLGSEDSSASLDDVAAHLGERRATGAFRLALGDTIRAHAIDLRIDASRLTGSIAVTPGGVPAVDADLALDRIDLDSYPAGARTSQGGALAGLTDRVEARIKARIGSLTFGGNAIEGLSLDGRLERGVLILGELAVTDFLGAAGKASGTVSDLAGTPQVDLTLEAKAADATGLLRLAGADPPAGLGGMALTARVQGGLPSLVVDAELAAAGGRAKIAGTLTDIAGNPSHEVRLDLSHPDLSRLLRRLGWDSAVPAGAVVVTGRVQGKLETMAVDGEFRFTAPTLKATGSIAANVSGGATAFATGRGKLAATLTPADGKPIRIVLDAPDWRLADDGESLRLDLARAELAFPDHAAALSRIEATARLIGDAASMKLTGELHDAGKPAAWAPLAVGLEGRRERDNLVFTGSAATRDRALVMKLSARHDLAGGRGSGTITSSPLIFEPHGRQPSELFPALGTALRRVEGIVGAKATLSWGRDHEPATTLALNLDGVGFEGAMTQVSGLRGDIVLDSLAPLRTAAPQQVTAMLAFAGQPPSPLVMRFSLPGGNRLSIDKASLAFAGGTMSLTDVAVEPGRPVRTSLDLREIDLDSLLKLIGIGGLSGSGALTGRIPVHVDESGVAIAGGKLAATGPGTLRYAGAGLKEAISAAGAAQGAPLVLLQEALADFRYSSLALTIDRAATGKGTLLLGLRGANPTVLNSHPFEINIRLETDFDRFAGILFEGYAAAELMLRRFAEP